jgi:hypothetical protein
LDRVDSHSAYRLMTNSFYCNLVLFVDCKCEEEGASSFILTKFFPDGTTEKLPGTSLTIVAVSVKKSGDDDCFSPPA